MWVWKSVPIKIKLLLGTVWPGPTLFAVPSAYFGLLLTVKLPVNCPISQSKMPCSFDFQVTSVTVKILKIGTYRSQQTVQTQIRLIRSSLIRTYTICQYMCMFDLTIIYSSNLTRTVRKSDYTPALALPKHMAGILDEKCREKEKYREQQIGECPFSIPCYNLSLWTCISNLKFLS